MQKTRLGIPVGLFGAAIYFLALFGGYLTAVLLAVYVLLFEGNEWLEKTSVKAVVLLILFSLLTAVVNLIPSAISFINNIAAMFGGSFSITALSRLVSALINAVEIVERVMFILLGIKALSQGTIAVPVADALIKKYMR